MSRLAAPIETDEQRRQREREALALLLLFLWDADQFAYFTRGGGRVTQADLRAAVDAVVEDARSEVASLGRQVAAGEITVAEWQRQVATVVKEMHVATAAAGAGGFANMTGGDIAELQRLLQFTITRLEGFAQDIARGFTTVVVRGEQIDSLTGEVQQVTIIRAVTEAAIVARSEMYAAAGRGGFENIRRAKAFEAGLTEERRILHSRDHCKTCVEEAAKLWQPIGTLRELGDSECLVNCLCTWAFR